MDMDLEQRILAVLPRAAPGSSASDVSAHLDPAPVSGELGAALETLVADGRVIRHQPRRHRRIGGGVDRYYRTQEAARPRGGDGQQALFG